MATADLRPPFLGWRLPLLLTVVEAVVTDAVLSLPNARQRATNSWAAVRDTFFSTKEVLEGHRVVFTVGTSIVSALMPSSQVEDDPAAIKSLFLVSC
ncbi:unnamed protein product [Triticum turgidum subsp. durum]|uniref:Secreted protein n=1 Tax=Triticum turgidum subsp. durum TaxID=4567 RepID=A0A9R1QF20_TRITD|nr:unnamed protein product [Triticum turgidum subsp. durum]